MSTLPWSGCPTAITRTGSPPSTSVSLANTLIWVAGAFRVNVTASAEACGASSTQVTATVTVALEPPLTVYVNVSSRVPGGTLQ